MLETLGDRWILGHGLGEGIGQQLAEEQALSIFGDKLTCSRAWNCKSAGYSLTQLIRGPVPVVHLEDRALRNSKCGFFPMLREVSTLLRLMFAVLSFLVSADGTLADEMLSEHRTLTKSDLDPSLLVTFKDGISSSTANFCNKQLHI